MPYFFCLVFGVERSTFKFFVSFLYALYSKNYARTFYLNTCRLVFWLRASHPCLSLFVLPCASSRETRELPRTPPKLILAIVQSFCLCVRARFTCVRAGDSKFKRSALSRRRALGTSEVHDAKHRFHHLVSPAARYLITR